jgi:hypothetical protein
VPYRLASSENEAWLAAKPHFKQASSRERYQPFGGRTIRSILAAMMKSFSCNPLIFLVRKDTVA